MPKNGAGVPFSLSLLSKIEKVWMRGWGEERQDFPSKISCLTVPKNAVGEPFCHCLILGIESLVKSGGGEEERSITIFCRKLLFHNAENFCRGTLLCPVSEKFRQRKCLWIRSGGVSRFSVENFLSHIAENFRRGTLLCCVSKNLR